MIDGKTVDVLVTIFIVVVEVESGEIVESVRNCVILLKLDDVVVDVEVSDRLCTEPDVDVITALVMLLEIDDVEDVSTADVSVVLEVRVLRIVVSVVIVVLVSTVEILVDEVFVLLYRLVEAGEAELESVEKEVDIDIELIT